MRDVQNLGRLPVWPPRRSRRWIREDAEISWQSGTEVQHLSLAFWHNFPYGVVVRNSGRAVDVESRSVPGFFTRASYPANQLILRAGEAQATYFDLVSSVALDPLPRLVDLLRTTGSVERTRDGFIVTAEGAFGEYDRFGRPRRYRGPDLSVSWAFGSPRDDAPDPRPRIPPDALVEVHENLAQPLDLPGRVAGLPFRFRVRHRHTDMTTATEAIAWRRGDRWAQLLFAPTRTDDLERIGLLNDDGQSVVALAGQTTAIVSASTERLLLRATRELTREARVFFGEAASAARSERDAELRLDRTAWRQATFNRIISASEINDRIG